MPFFHYFKAVPGIVLLLLSVASCNAQAGHKKALPASDTSRRQVKLVKTQGSDQYANIHCILQDRSGNIWIGTTGEGVYRYDGKRFAQFTVKDGLSNNTLYTIAEDKEGNIWFGTGDGISRYDGRHITVVPIPAISYSFHVPSTPDNNGTAKNEVWSIMCDKTGKLWLGTANGLYCYDGMLFTRFLDKAGIINRDSLRLKMVSCMLEDKDGIIWLGSGMLPGDEGICRYDPATGELTSFKPEGDGWIRYLLADRQNNIWIGTRHAGIWRYDGKLFTRFRTDNDIGLAAMADQAGNIWLSGGEKNDGYSSDGSIWLYDGTSLKRLLSGTMGYYGVWSMLEDKRGAIWFGTRNNGLYRYDGKTITSFSQ